MSKSIQFNVSFTGDTKGTIDVYPDECPFCHSKITPTVIGGNVCEEYSARVIFLCPSDECREPFIGYYQGQYTDYQLLGTGIGHQKNKEFHESINQISPNFVKIYNEAYHSEQYRLTQICGVGYRKALEFLIKDFAIRNHPEKEALIKKDTLTKVIIEHIEDAKVKIVAERAVWLGNDETHYVRIWEDKDLKDLKMVIDLTITMIQGAYDFEKLTKDMPKVEKKK